MAENQDVLAPQADPREALAEILKAIRRNRARVVFTTLVFLMLGYGLALVWPNKYESKTTFHMRDRTFAASVGGRLDDLTGLSEIKRTQAMQSELSSRKRIEEVLNQLQWPEWLETASSESSRRELLEKIRGNLKVDMQTDVTGKKNVDISFAWTSPRKAADFANRLRDAWIQRTIESRRKSLEDEYERQHASLRRYEAELTDALEARRKYEDENKVSTLLTTEANNELKVRHITEQAALNAQLQIVLGEIDRLRSEMEATPSEVPAGLTAASPEEAEALQKVQLAKDELERLSDPVTGFKPAHSLRRSAQAKFDAAYAALLATGWTAESPDGEPRMQTNPAYYELGKLLALKQAEELGLRTNLAAVQVSLEEAQENLDSLPVVQQELERLTASIETAKAMLNLKKEQVAPINEEVQRLRAQSVGADSRAFADEGGDFEILETAVEAENPVLPISAIVLAVSLLVGLGIGAMGPVLREMTRSSFGTVKEVSRSLGVPVLGAVDLILTTRDLRARAVQRALTYATMTLVLAALGTALFIYRNHQEVLPGEVLRAVRALRMALT